jgi:peptide deformylase
MTVRPLRLLGDPVLRTPSDLVARFDDGLAQLVTDLLDTVQLPGRAGLAANQIGSSLAVFAYNVEEQLGYVINPVLAETIGEQSGEEGCLSIPGVSANRRRAAHAVVTGVDLEQRPVTVAGDGELARGGPVGRVPRSTATGGPVGRVPRTTATGGPVGRVPRSTATGGPAD